MPIYQRLCAGDNLWHKLVKSNKICGAYRRPRTQVIGGAHIKLAIGNLRMVSSLLTRSNISQKVVTQLALMLGNWGHLLKECFSYEAILWENSGTISLTYKDILDLVRTVMDTDKMGMKFPLKNWYLIIIGVTIGFGTS